MLIEFLVAHDSARPDEAERAGYTVHQGHAGEPWAQSLRALSRTPVDILWIAWEALESAGVAGIDALRRFRVARAETRILIEIPDDLSPPQALLGQCVALGIVDFVPVSLPFPDACDRHPTYADVARWQGGAWSWEEGPTETPEQPAIVREPPEKQVVLIASPARPVVLVVLGAHIGAGATTTALALAHTLSQAGHSTVLTEAMPTDTYRRIDTDRLGYAVVLPEPPPPRQTFSPARHVQSLIGRRTWSYIVVDGVSYQWDLAQKVGDMVVVIGPGSPYRQAKWHPVAERLTALHQARPDVISVCVLHADPGAAETVQVLRETMQTASDPPTGVFLETPDVWPDLLAPVLPWPSVRLPHRRWWPAKLPGIRRHPAGIEAATPAPSRPFRIPLRRGPTRPRRQSGAMRSFWATGAIRGVIQGGLSLGVVIGGLWLAQHVFGVIPLVHPMLREAQQWIQRAGPKW
jgi:hypothetical protein